MVASTKSNRSHTPRKPASGGNFARKAAAAAKPNASILSFFKKVENKEGSLFLGVAPDLPSCEDGTKDDDVERYNEVDLPNKKRRLSREPEEAKKELLVKQDSPVKQTSAIKQDSPVKEKSPIKPDLPSSPVKPKSSKARIKTGFVMDSDSEDEADEPVNITIPMPEKTPQCADPIPKFEFQLDHFAKDEKKDQDEPAVLKQADSIEEQFEHLGDFDDVSGLDTGDLEGEEMREMLFMREQARLEAEEAGGFSSEDFADDAIDEGAIESCPICNGSLVGISADEATRHVNSCLDGNPIPLPQKDKKSSPKKEEPPDVQSGEISKRFARAAVPRPGQANPFELASPATAPKSAFSKLMSNKVEDSAWASAAAAETKSRGRPAYERTCPFYKIMPGFSICVDAFRYGAVEGCKAYFLSHFHSDHYIGLTASWRHGPIYCSKVTGSLVKQQLRTAAKWVVELEFEKLYDIPGTDGATVTMIPANHCPGSSLFLFEKTMGKGRVQRILHCGDFRACPAHVSHELLKPNTVDSLSGRVKQQKIDICYLDTTYLNPRYSFPPQNDVIKACADLIGGMSPDPNCKGDVWDKAANTSGTPTVSRFFQSTGGKEDTKPTATKKGPRQRLLVICGTYSIGKERICVAIAKALGSKIFASPGKIKICKQLGDAELSGLLTSNPREAQVHMQMLMEIRAETLQDYLDGYKPHFSRIVGFRPSGWNFRPAGGGKTTGANTSPGSVPTEQVLHGKGWRTRFGYRDFVAQRGSTREAMCFGVPYSEHSSFRELAMFVMSLRIERVVPTVNVGSEQSRKRMKAWTDRWLAERRRGGFVTPLVEGRDEEEAALWDGKSSKGGGAWW